jgi:hypothetical protein
LSFGKNVSANMFEVHIVKLHVDEKLLMGDGPRPHIDPLKWRPLVMSFCRFFGSYEICDPGWGSRTDVRVRDGGC